MIKHSDAIRTARILLGTPYKEMDCIALIRAVIKRSAGGVTDYRCEGTNWLWRSIGNSGKYKHLTERWETIESARAGMLAFKRSGDDVHHVGLVTGDGTVIHSSSTKGCVVETELDDSWDLLGQHRYIEVATQIPNDVSNNVSNDTVGENCGIVGEGSGIVGINSVKTLLIRDDGTVIELSGVWRVAED